MWKILGLVVLCSLLSPSEGNAFANRAIWSQTGCVALVTNGFMHDGILLNELKRIELSDVGLGELHGWANGIGGFKIEDLEVTDEEIVLLPKMTGANFSLSFRLKIAGRKLHDSTKLVSIILDMNFQFKYSLGKFQKNSFDMVIRECVAVFGEFKITTVGRTFVPSVVNKVRNSIISDINLQICGILQGAANLMISFMVSTVNVALPVGHFATLRCSLSNVPSVYLDSATVDTFIDVELPSGEILSIPNSVPNIDVPPLGNFKHCQAFHPEFFNILLPILAPKPIKLSCIQDQFSGADDLKNAILALVSLESHNFISKNTLLIKISIVANPVVVFGTNGTIISATIRIEISFKHADGSTFSVVILRSRLTMTAAISLVNGKLIFRVSLSDHVLELISSEAGISDVSTLKSHCGKLVTEIFLTVFNGNLSVGIPVLPVFGMKLDNPIFLFIRGALVGCI